MAAILSRGRWDNVGYKLFWICFRWSDAVFQMTDVISGNLMVVPMNTTQDWYHWRTNTTVYPKKYAHGFVVLCFVVVMQSFIKNSHEVFIHIHQGCFAGTGAIVRLPQCQWSKPDGYGKISQCITTTKHSKAKTVCIFLGIHCNLLLWDCCYSLQLRLLGGNAMV